MKYTRKAFLRHVGLLSGSLVTGMGRGTGTPRIGTPGKRSNGNKSDNMIEIAEVSANFEREPLIRPFGFKGGFLREIWQTIARLKSTNGHEGLGLCSQSVLWSDSSVFANHTESGGNALMYAISERALQMIEGEQFRAPVQLQERILEELTAYAREITGEPDLRTTFVLNALVGVDNALWMLYAHENDISQFREMLPEQYRPSLSHRQPMVASVPVISYGTPISEITQAVEEGYFFLKLKLGQPGTQQEMLEKDMERITAIHNAIGDMRTPHTQSGRIPYYFDANGRYERKETLLRLLDHARNIGAFDQIEVMEEPFPEELTIDVHDIPVRLAADESAHTDRDAIERIEMGYSAIALKSVAKTMSMTMKIAQAAYERGVPCFCADLTVNPVLVEWNKIVAANVAPFPNLGMGLMETNGHQNYDNWERMRRYHPFPDAQWANAENGVFELGDDYYEKSGGIFEIPKHYYDLVTVEE
ncbi:MAG: enolase C-terminal domain-like protein [Balneolaceae bacterium]|nr:enolase C-terminal domain-like protein [Balneolaceae bacterium]